MAKIAEEVANPNEFLNGLLENYAPTDATFDVVLPKGEVVKFKAFQTYADVADFKREASAFAKKVATLKGAKGHPFFALHTPRTDEEAIVAYSIHALAVEPAFSIPQAFALLKAPWLTEHIMDQIDRHRMAYLLQGNPVEEAKKD